jgi:hypothetical protein
LHYIMEFQFVFILAKRKVEVTVTVYPFTPWDLIPQTSLMLPLLIVYDFWPRL